MSATFTAFRALVRKDIQLFLRDRRALVVSVLTPIVVAAFFGFLFAGTGAGGNTISRMKVGVTDLDHSALTKAVLESLNQDASLEIQELPEDQALQLVRSGKLRAAMVFPVGFETAATGALVGLGAMPDVKLLYDPSQSMIRPMVAGLLSQHVMQRLSRPNFIGNAKPIPFNIDNVAVTTGPRYNSYSHSFAGMSIQFILFMGIDAGIALLLMRQEGMWRRLRAAPLSRAVLLGSRVTGTTLIAMGILAVVYLVARLVFDVRIAGSVPGFVMVACAFALLAATTGLMIASLGRSVGATRGVAMFSVLILVMLGGAWVPSFVFPEWLQHLTEFVPTRWAVDGLDQMTWRGLPLQYAWEPTAILVGWSALFTLIAVWRFNWEDD
ncbi:MAG TPA: ABC transporter permease [Steroidobacteraceae bacterium]|jgi:ABC-2 type transport system permease protein|nr:ABC transporter permease [Steroidobacteraceae bacterium]